MAPRAHDCFDGIATACEANEAALAPPRPAPRTGRTYLWHAAVHPTNLVLLISVMFLGLVFWSAPVLLTGLGLEGLLLGVVPSTALFRRRIDEILDAADRAAAAKAREALVFLKMGETHRQELARIEALVAKIFANEGRHGVGSFPPGARLGLDQLSASYIRLAVAHKACEESLAMTNRQVLEGTIRTLETAEGASGERTREPLRRRIAVAYRRAECWTRTREDLEAIGHQLATIVELVQFLHQESLVSPEPAGVGGAIDRLLSDFEESAGVLRELAEICVEEPFDIGEPGAEGAVLARMP